MIPSRERVERGWIKKIHFARASTGAGVKANLLISLKWATMLAFPTMKPSEAFQAHRAAIRDIVERHRARNVRVFGSVLHGDDVEGGDLDLLVDPLPQTTLMDIAAIQVELERMLGVPVDVLTPKALPETFRGAVLAEAEPV